ncbi:uncharacterized protein V6R79_024067 [Siganus canaliculatus]
MYLMNVPPVAATQTEWRTCGPSGGYSLPVCFNDSDTELSARGTPISSKVQMIIESLRSTQSSLEMGDEIEGNVLSGQDGHPQVCKAAAGSYVGAKSKTKSPNANRQVDASTRVGHESSDSDSDDSVDRGIEEAILEYLKEKDDHKRKAEPAIAFAQPSKIPRKNPPVPEVSKQNSDSNTFLIASSQIPKSVKAETPMASAAVPVKKHIKNKDSLTENSIRKLDLNKSSAKSFVFSRDQMKTVNKLKCPVAIKVEEDSSDSSSDDGIEEAIQRYQLEKKEQQGKRNFYNLHAFKEESDSTSDDGIEEAIRSYQLEQRKEKSVMKPFSQKQKHLSKSVIQMIGSTSTETITKHKTKKRKSEKEKPVQPQSSSNLMPKDGLSSSSKGKGNGLHSFKVGSFKEQPAPTTAPPKVNTTAELMCAEAILDISKTVMPGPFHHSAGLSSCTESHLRSSPRDDCPDEESDGSSIDSEDGIEQEIRKFLEQKAQMHKQLPGSAAAPEPHSLSELEGMKSTLVAPQKKPSRLSLTQRRRNQEGDSSVSNMLKSENVVETGLTSLTEQRKESSTAGFAPKSPSQSIAESHRTEPSGDKSSSLDSDEDLDTAIKDLLKTKKKCKKKTRDLKRKSKKQLKDEETVKGNSLQAKKLKPVPVSKLGALKKVQKRKEDVTEKSGLNKMTVLQLKQTKSKEHDVPEGQAEKLKDAPLLHNNSAPQIRDDSSSVDSDDSIEQEIRKFLAEKAKVSTTEKSRDGDISRNGTAAACSPPLEEDIKMENQLAEIPRKSVRDCPGRQSPVSGQPFLMTQSSQSVIASVSAQSRLTSVQSSSPSLLEPADGAGAARSAQRRPSIEKGDAQDISAQTDRVRPVLTPNSAHARAEAIKWRQSLGLPITNTRTPSRTFHITTSKTSETASAAPQFQSRIIPPKTQTPHSAWASARTSGASLPSSAETTVNATSRSPVLNRLSPARHPRMSFTHSLAPGHRSQCPIEEETKSMVHMPKDKTVFVELESNRTNHVQVRSRDRSEGKERLDFLSQRKREGESVKIENAEVHLERTEEDFVDEADCESGNRRNPEKMQGFSTL